MTRHGNTRADTAYQISRALDFVLKNLESLEPLSSLRRPRGLHPDDGDLPEEWQAIEAQLGNILAHFGWDTEPLSDEAIRRLDDKFSAMLDGKVVTTMHVCKNSFR